MGLFETLVEDIKKTIQETLKETIRELIHEETTDKWLSKKQLAEYWGVSESYINKNLDNIPHSAATPIAFLRSEANAWRKGELKKLEVVSNSKVSIKNYKSNNFRIGK